MGYLVAHHLRYSGLNFVAKATLSLNGFLENAYLIRQDQAISLPSPGSRHTLVKTKQLPGALCPSLSQLHCCGPLLYHDINVLQSALKFRRQTFDCPRHQTFKLFSLHINKTETLPTEARICTSMLPPEHAIRQTDSSRWYHQKRASILTEPAAVQEQFSTHET